MKVKIAIIKEMFADKIDINTIAKFTGLPIDKIAKLQK